VAELKARIEAARAATPLSETMQFRVEMEAAQLEPGDQYDLVHPVILVGDAIA
jgi:hypothetical protein